MDATVRLLLGLLLSVAGIAEAHVLRVVQNHGLQIGGCSRVVTVPAAAVAVSSGTAVLTLRGGGAHVVAAVVRQHAPLPPAKSATLSCNWPSSGLIIPETLANVGVPCRML